MEGHDKCVICGREIGKYDVRLTVKKNNEYHSICLPCENTEEAKEFAKDADN